MSATIWALLPPIIAIVLALITKEVYVSLVIGILSGAMLYSLGNPISAMEMTFDIMGTKIGENINIVIFLVFLGILVSLITKSGASAAYGNYASRKITTKRGGLFATIALGILIFVDDYFNCLTVGTVMKPVTDRHKISRQKLAYVIDATAAPVCIIAPISSWAAAVGSSLPEDSGIDGFNLFLRTIPFNLYALLTIAFLLFLVWTNMDFFSMRKYEKQAAQEDISSEEVDAGKGKVFDLIIPIVVLIVSCIAMMLYTGGIFESYDIIDAFANCSSAASLVYGSFITIIFTACLYLPRKVISFKEFAASFVDGFKAMTPAIMILCLAWTLSGVCSAEYLDLGGYVNEIVSANTGIIAYLPALFFLVSLGLAFATGTSWGTFGILVPIAFTVISDDLNMFTIIVAAVLAGAICGDHVSPISDTTILASAGAECEHITHVSTQMPYAFLVALCCLAGYVVAGFTENGFLGLATGAAALVVVALVLWICGLIVKKREAKKEAA